jgi:hypothetical protein
MNKIFIFNFQNNSISNNWASLGIVAFFEGLDLVNQSEKLIQRIKIKKPFSNRNNLVVGSISSLKFWNTSSHDLSSLAELKIKVFF